MSEYIIDTYAWLEYLDGSPKGEIVRSIVQSSKCFTSAVTLAEVVSVVERRGKDTKSAISAVVTNSIVLNVDEAVATKVGMLHAVQKKKIKDFGLADAFVLAQRESDQIIVTGDPHFKDVKNVKMV